MTRPQGCGWRNGLQYGGQLRIYSISSRGQPTRCGPSARGLSEVLKTPHRKIVSCYVTPSIHGAQIQCLRHKSPGLAHILSHNDVFHTLNTVHNYRRAVSFYSSISLDLLSGFFPSGLHTNFLEM